MQKKLLYFNKTRKATWLELFFDLIFVVTLGKITHFLTHTHNGHLSDGIWLKFVGVFIPLWWIWVGHTGYSNRFDKDGRVHRVVTLVLMSFLIALSVIINKDIYINFSAFVVIYVMARFLIASMYFFASKNYPKKAELPQKLSLFFSFGALISLSSLFLKSPYLFYVFYGGILFDILVPLVIKDVLKTLPVDREHLVERIGLLAMILLGESLISVSNSLNGVEWSLSTIFIASLGYIYICIIWWIYFDSFYLLINSKNDINGTAILYSQLLTYMSFAILANLIGHAIMQDLVLNEYKIMSVIGVLMFYIGKQIAYVVNIPEYSYYIIRNTVIVLTLSGLSLFLPSIQAIFGGTICSLAAYIGLTYRAQTKLSAKFTAKYPIKVL